MRAKRPRTYSFDGDQTMILVGWKPLSLRHFGLTNYLVNFSLINLLVIICCIIMFLIIWLIQIFCIMPYALCMLMFGFKKFK